MHQKKIRRLREEIAVFRRVGGVRSRDLERLAARLGRRRHRRGKEPTWVSDVLPGAPPLSIPSHARDLNRITARTILDVLEADLDAIERRIAQGGPDA
jgi:hypothetical protein